MVTVHSGSPPPITRRSTGAASSADLHVVFASIGCADSRVVDDVVPRLTSLSDVWLKLILDRGFRDNDVLTASTHGSTQLNLARDPTGGRVADDLESEALDLCGWADVLVLAPADANTLAKMLHGHTDTLVLEMLRAWDVSKRILLIPGMSTRAWENPMTKKQLSKIRKKWNWVRVLQPLLWEFAQDRKKVLSWEPVEELVDALRNLVDLMNIGQDVEYSPTTQLTVPTIKPRGKSSSNSLLPPELWTMIFDFTGDWELAQNLHVYTNLPPPADWQNHTSSLGPRNYMESLELTILRGNLAAVKHFIATHSVPRWLSKLCIRLIMRFAMTPLLAHLEATHQDLFWQTFGHTFLPDKASSVFGRTEILEFWRTSPSFLTKEYGTEALDVASKAGFVHVLEWWQHSGLPLKFTEAALEQASSQGHLAVLEWWKNQSSSLDDNETTTNNNKTSSSSSSSSSAIAVSADPSKIRLRPGKSISYATQNGRTDVVRWWLRSGIAFAHEDAVAKLASTHDHVAILQLWFEAKGSKMIFDNQVLVGPTKHGHVGVLEWWKQSGLKVEYKTCDIEEALEDGDEGERGLAVRRWWARNGLNLGVGTSEWMKTKILNS